MPKILIDVSILDTYYRWLCIKMGKCRKMVKSNIGFNALLFQLKVSCKYANHYLIENRYSYILHYFISIIQNIEILIIVSLLVLGVWKHAY